MVDENIIEPVIQEEIPTITQEPDFMEALREEIKKEDIQKQADIQKQLDEAKKASVSNEQLKDIMKQQLREQMKQELESKTNTETINKESADLKAKIIELQEELNNTTNGSKAAGINQTIAPVIQEIEKTPAQIEDDILDKELKYFGVL